MLEIAELGKTSPEHRVLCKDVLKILKTWVPKMAFLWEWTRGVESSGTMTYDEEDIPLAIKYSTYDKKFSILVAPSALTLAKPDLEIAVLHELGHIFLSNLRCIHQNEVHDDSKVGTNNWFDHEEEACWRFAKLLYETTKA